MGKWWWVTTQRALHTNYWYAICSPFQMHANDTLVEHNVFGTGHGASIGSLGKGTYLKNITVRHNSFDGAVDALRIKSDVGATGFLRDVTYSDNTMVRTSGHTIYITMNYPKPDPGVATTFKIR